MITKWMHREDSQQIPLIPMDENRHVEIPTCYYVATSLDGLIADVKGSIDWLKPFFEMDYGFHDFLDSIDTVVMGRRTYDRFLQASRTNPYLGKHFVVISHTRSSGPHAELFWPGHLRGLMLRLEAMGSRSLWIVGGGSVAGAFLEAGLLDEVQQLIIPMTLGAGTPLFGPLRQPASFCLKESQSFANGVLRLRYVPVG
jgi:dihydrofolate reductase